MLTRRERYLLLFASFLAGLVLSGGCGPLGEEFAIPGAAAPVPSELAPFQGKWKLDKIRLPGIEAEGEADEESTGDDQALLRAMQQLGVAMGDIEIRGTRITQLGGILQAQYDLLDYRADDGTITGTALWHEDKHDPGDASEIKVTLELSGDKLVFTGEDIEEGVAERFYFSR